MYLSAHAALGWTFGAIPPWSDRRVRGLCLLAAVIPDVDAAALVMGKAAYVRWHHTFGHSALLGMALVGLAVILERRRSAGRIAAAAILVALSFGAHLVTDAYFTRYPVFALWPFSRAEFSFAEGYELDDSINKALHFVAVALFLAVAWWKKATPLEVISPNLDAIVLGFFRPRRLRCGTCRRPTAYSCDFCGGPTCLNHGRIARGFRIRCPKCDREVEFTHESPPG